MKSDGKTCGICFDKILSTGKINSCEHDFHYKCIARWSRISSNCPTCRIAFTEISHIKCGKLLKKVRINDDYQTTEEDISNSDIEEWQAACSICHLTSPEFLLACEGGLGCSNVVHSYCLPQSSSSESWVCEECENEASESLASENSSLAESGSLSESERNSDPDADYTPKIESPVYRRTSSRLSGKNNGRELLELGDNCEVDSFIESDSDDFSDDKSFSEDVLVPTRRSVRVARRRFSSSENSPVRETRHRCRNLQPRPAQDPPVSNSPPSSPGSTQPRQLRRLKRNNESEILPELPVKRTREFSGPFFNEQLGAFVANETKRELERNKPLNINPERLTRIMIGTISRSDRLKNIDDPRTVQKIRTVIKNHIAGLI